MPGDRDHPGDRLHETSERGRRPRRARSRPGVTHTKRRREDRSRIPASDGGRILARSGARSGQPARAAPARGQRVRRPSSRSTSSIEPPSPVREGRDDAAPRRGRTPRPNRLAVIAAPLGRRRWCCAHPEQTATGRRTRSDRPRHGDRDPAPEPERGSPIGPRTRERERRSSGPAASGATARPRQVTWTGDVPRRAGEDDARRSGSQIGAAAAANGDDREPLGRQLEDADRAGGVDERERLPIGRVARGAQRRAAVGLARRGSGVGADPSAGSSIGSASPPPTCHSHRPRPAPVSASARANATCWPSGE